MTPFVLPSHYTSGMIFQRNMPIRIEGTASEPCTITLQLAEDSTTQYFTPGKVSMILPARSASRDLTLKITVKTETEETVTSFTDIYVGEIWIAGGQSNMAWPLNDTDEYRDSLEIVENSDVRFFTVGRVDKTKGLNQTPEPDLGWQGCTGESALEFSAVAYHFARIIYEEMRIPIGIINCNFGGSSILAWLSKEYTKNEFFITPEWEGFIHHVPSGLYDTMLSKIVNFPCRGMLWYQGETEGFDSRASYYGQAQEALLNMMKYHQKNPEFAFHYVQIAPWENPQAVTWADICNAQRQFHIDNPECALITIGDVGGDEDIHPPRKLQVGERLAYAAMNITYGLDSMKFTGPIATKATKVGREIRVDFTHATAMYVRGEIGSFQLLYDDPAGGIEYIDVVNPVVRDCAVYLPLPKEEVPPYVRDKALLMVQYEYVSNYKVGLKNSAGFPASLFKLLID